MKIQVNDQTYFISWRHKSPETIVKNQKLDRRAPVKGPKFPFRGSTECTIVKGEPKGEVIGKALVTCYYKDTFTKQKGRINSLRRALVNSEIPNEEILPILNLIK